MSRIKGHALAIDFLDGFAADARIIEHSRVLEVERIHNADNDATNAGRRRFGFVEHFGSGAPAPTGLNRPVGDAFFADRATAEFAWQAIMGKIENDAEEKSSRGEAFKIFGATIATRDQETVLSVAVVGLSTGICRFIEFPIVSESDLRQRVANSMLDSLLAAIERPDASECVDLLGGVARGPIAGRYETAPVQRAA